MGMPPEADKVWLHTGVIVCGYEIQSTPHESELIIYFLLIYMQN